MNICQHCVMLRVPMALAFKELSNTGRSDGNPGEKSERDGGWDPLCQTAARTAQGGAAETTRGKWELLAEQSEVDNNGHIFSLPTERHHTFPCVNQEVQLRRKGPLGSVGSERGEELGGGKLLPCSLCCLLHPFFEALAHSSALKHHQFPSAGELSGTSACLPGKPEPRLNVEGHLFSFFLRSARPLAAPLSLTKH